MPLFFQLVDKGTGAVLGNQTIPYVFGTDPEPQSLSFPIEGVSYDVAETDQLVLEINSKSANYLVQRGGGVFNIEEVSVDLPVVQPGASEARRGGGARRTRRFSAPAGACSKKKRGSIASSSMSMPSPTKSTRA